MNLKKDKSLCYLPKSMKRYGREPIAEGPFFLLDLKLHRGIF